MGPTLHFSMTVDYCKVIVVCELTVKPNLRLATSFCNNISGALTPICQITPPSTEKKRVTLLLKRGGKTPPTKPSLLNTEGDRKLPRVLWCVCVCVFTCVCVPVGMPFPICKYTLWEFSNITHWHNASQYFPNKEGKKNWKYSSGLLAMTSIWILKEVINQYF